MLPTPGHKSGGHERRIEMEKDIAMVINAVKRAYIEVMGVEKWMALTDREQHDVIMILVKDLNNSIR